MQATSRSTFNLSAWLGSNWIMVGSVLIMGILPFVVAVIDGQSFSGVMANDAGNAKFIMGLMIEVMILAIYALSYDLILGITGLLSFGHAMFFATGAYLTGIAFKNLGWGIIPTLLAVVAVGIIQAVLFGIVLPRVKGVTFALVTLGLAAVFEIIIKSRELGQYTGADVGLQGIVPPDFLNPSNERMRLYYLALIITVLIYLAYRRFVDSPTGRVCVAIRENEERALMLGYNTFWFKLAALIVASVTAAFAGTMHAIYQPLVSPNVAGLGYTVIALLIILIGGVGTLGGALVGALVFRLLSFFLDKYFGESASFLLGAVYIGLVLFVPYGIVGTIRQRALNASAGRARLARILTGTPSSPTENGDVTGE